MDVSELRGLIAAEFSKAQAIHDAASEENREPSDEEVERLDEHNDKIEAYQAELERKEKLRASIERTERAKARLRNEPGKKARPERSVVEHVRESVADDPTAGFDSLGEFAQAVFHAGTNTGMDSRLAIHAAASGMSQGVAADGGFAVPPAYSNTIWSEASVDNGVNLMSLCRRYPVTGASLTFAANAETSRADGSRYGGVQGYWLCEAAQKTSSNPTLRQVKLEPEELAVLVYATDKLLKNNTMALEAYLQEAATEEIQFKVNDAIINGTGAGMPQGIMNSGCLITASAEGGQPATTFVAENVLAMWARLHPRARRNAVWFINQDVEPQLHKMYLPTGGGGSLVYTPAGGVSGAPYATLMGRPVREIEFAQTLGTTGDVILADLGFYALGTRGGIEAATSIHLRFDYNETCFRFVFAIDGQSFLASAITPKNGTNTVSPFVVLETRS